MPTLAEPRSARLPDRVLAVAVPVLIALFLVAPAGAAAHLSGTAFTGENDLRAALGAAFATYWNTGNPALPPELTAVVDYWFWYHLVKAVVAGLLTAVLVVATVRIWRAWARPAWQRQGTRMPLVAAGAGATVLGLGALTALAANVQGAVAPLASLLPMLTDGPTEVSATAVAGVRWQLSRVLDGGTPAPPVLDALIEDFARYHLAMVVVAVLVALGLLGATLLLWRRCARTDRADHRTRRLLAAYAVLAALLTVGALVVAGANTSTAVRPTPALGAFFDGGW